MHAPRWAHKLIVSVLVISLLLPGAYVALTPSAPAEAQFLTFGTTIVDIPFIVDKILEIVKFAIDVALYKTIAFAVRKIGSDAAQGTARLISGGKVGNEPLFFEQPAGQWVEQMGEQAGGFFIEGMAEGIAVEEELAKNPGMSKDRILKEKKGSIIPRAQELVNQMCNPDPRFRLSLLAGLVGNMSFRLGLPIPLFFALQTKKDAKPACTFTQAYKNWKNVIVDTTMKEWGDVTKFYDTMVAFPGKFADAAKKDIDSIKKGLDNLGALNATLAKDQKFQNSKDALINHILGKLDPSSASNLDPKDPNNVSQYLTKIQQTLQSIPNDPDVTTRITEMEAAVNATNDNDAKATFQDAKRRIMTIANNPLLTQLIGDTKQANTDQQKATSDIQNARQQGKPTGWQVLQDLTDPNKQDQAIESKSANLLDDFIKQMERAATLERTDPGVPRPQTQLSGTITSPPFTVQSFVASSLGAQGNAERMTGNLQADAANLIGEFADSLFAKSGEMLKAGFTVWMTESGGSSKKISDAIGRAVANLPSPEEKARVNQDIVDSLPPDVKGNIGKPCSSGGLACSDRLFCNPVTGQCEVPAIGSKCGTGNFCSEAEIICGTANANRSPDRPILCCNSQLVCELNPAPREIQGIAETGDEYPTPGDESNDPTYVPSSDAITNPSFSAEHAKRTSIQARISKLVSLPRQKEESFNILANLQADCTPGNPDSCTITRPFGQAIQEKLTIAEAVVKFRSSGGITGLDERLVFGFKRGYAGQAIEPDISQGIPYSSMIVLRKYRVIPVAWELVALYIRDHPNTCGAKDCTLGDVLRQYSTLGKPLYRMIDPNWVLKAPGAKCMLKGYGPPVVQQKSGQGDTDENAQWVCKDNDSTTKPTDGSAPKCTYEYKIQPRSEICLDQQTCLDETSSGKCKAYGYCLEEKKRWQFAGTECKKRYASCLTFTNTATKVSASFLRDTVFTSNFGYSDSGGTCDATNANCAKYSKKLELKKDKNNTNLPGNRRSDYDWDPMQIVYFTPTAKERGSCTADAEGCRALVHLKFNPLSNSGAESGDTSSWTVRDFGIDDSSGSAYVAFDRPFHGTKYFAANNDGGLNRPVTLTAGATYTLAARMRVHASNINNTGDASAGYLVVGTDGTSRDVADELCNINQYDQEPTLGAWSLCTKTFTAPQNNLYVGFRSAGNTHSISVDTVVLLAGALPDNYYSTPLQSSTTGNETLAALYGDEVRGATHMKVAPYIYGCDQNLDGRNKMLIVGYKKEICKGFAPHCMTQYAGCAKYTPTNGDPAIAGVNPDSMCNTACIGMTSFKQQPTQLETPTTWDDFIATAATQCSAESVGCDEYTNLETGAVAEQKDAYSHIAQCVKVKSSPEEQRIAHQDVFYSWTGSDQAGAQLEKFLLSSSNDTTGRNPVCWKNPQGKNVCGCEPTLNGPGRPLCREFFRLKPDGTQDTAQSWWRIQDDLVFVTPAADCTQYRRTIEQQQYLISKSMSKKCAVQFAGCREYHASQAGAISALPPDSFDAGTINWTESPGSGNQVSLISTNEGETLNDKSLRASNTNDTASSTSIQKSVDLKNGSVIISFAIQGALGATLTTRLFASENETNDAKALVGEGSAWTAQTLDGTWQYFRYSAVNLSLSQGSSPVLRITTAKDDGVAAQFYLDDVVVRQSEGIAYVVKDSWNGKVATACYGKNTDNTTDWNTGDPNQMNCREYTDKDGKRLVFQRFGTLCPSEMVGCKQFVYADSAQPAVILVDDPKKYCKPTDNKCTAYGLPRLDAQGVVQSYQNVYYKITPEEAGKDTITDNDRTRGICKSNDLECTDFTTKYGHEYFKNPGKKILRWRVAKDATERSSYPEGVWYRMTCSTKDAAGTKTDFGTDCITDSQCSASQKCDFEHPYTSPTATGTTGYAALCPSDQSTCSQIIDPECRAAKVCSGDKEISCSETNPCPADKGICEVKLSNYFTLRTNYGRTSDDTGTTCQREYHYLDDVYASTKQCTSQVNVEAGCLLFDSKYPAEGQGKTVANKYNTSTIYATADLRLGRSISAAEAQPNDVGKDANTLLKVKLDRACKTWLGCIQESVDSFGTRTCTKRSPCVELDDNGECANFLDVDTPAGKAEAPQLKQTFPVSNTVTDATSDMTFASLSGLSRPTLTINAILVGSKVIPPPPNADGVTVIPHDGLFNWSGNESKINTTSVGHFGLSNDISAICRAHPQKDTPIAKKENLGGITKDTRSTPLITSEQCTYPRSGSSYQGLMGFCLETYAKPGYGNYCLNWYPTDKPEGALAASTGVRDKAYKVTTTSPTVTPPVNYCIKDDTVTLISHSSWDSAANDAITSLTKKEDGSKTPTAFTLTFQPLEVRNDGDNKCGAYSISPGWQCSQARSSDPCTSAAMFGRDCNTTCNVTSKNCNTPPGWQAINANSCNNNNTCEIHTYGNVCNSVQKKCSNDGTNPNFVQDCSVDTSCRYRKPCTKRVRRSIQCAPSHDWNRCSGIGNWNNDGWECRYDGWDCRNDMASYVGNNGPTDGGGNDRQNWTNCAENDSSACPTTLYKDEDCSYDTNGKCMYSSEGSCKLNPGESQYDNPNLDYDYCWSSGPWGDANGANRKCSVKKSSTCVVSEKKCANTAQTICTNNDPGACAATCTANAGTQKMSCSTNGSDQSTLTIDNDDKGYIAIQTGTITAPIIKIKNADNVDVDYPVSLIKANIQSITYTISGITVSVDDPRKGASMPGSTTTTSTILDGRFGYATALWGDPPTREVSGSTLPFNCDTRYQFLVIIPSFNGSGSTLNGFKYVMCMDAGAATKSATVSATINFKPQNYKSIKETRLMTRTETYCKEFAQAAKANGEAIPFEPRRDNSWTPDALGTLVLTNPYSYGASETTKTREYRYIGTNVNPADANLLKQSGGAGTKIGSDIDATRDPHLANTPQISSGYPEYSSISSEDQFVITLDRIKSFFVKLYAFFTLKSDRSSYEEKTTATTATESYNTIETFWNEATSGGTYPNIVSRRCAYNNDAMCSYTQDCSADANACSVGKPDSFAITFPRESVNQQRATMQFYVWTDNERSPLRELWIRWGDGRYQNITHTVARDSSAAEAPYLKDNSDGFTGKVYPPDRIPPIQTNTIKAGSDDVKEFSFIYNYPRTFWPTHGNGTDICVFAQNNWYFWRQVCGRFKIGGGGFVELDKTYIERGFTNGWRTQTGKGKNSGIQDKPNAGVCSDTTQSNIISCWADADCNITPRSGNTCIPNR